jgi:hypothetical protein
MRFGKCYPHMNGSPKVILLPEGCRARTATPECLSVATK